VTHALLILRVYRFEEECGVKIMTPLPVEITMNPSSPHPALIRITNANTEITSKIFHLFNGFFAIIAHLNIYCSDYTTHD